MIDPCLHILHDLVPDPPPVDVRRPIIRVTRVVERERAHGRARGPRGEQRGLLRGGVLALGREEEARAQDRSGCAEREVRGRVDARRHAPCGEHGGRRTVLGERGEDFGDEQEGAGRRCAAVAPCLGACVEGEGGGSR